MFQNWQKKGKVIFSISKMQVGHYLTYMYSADRLSQLVYKSAVVTKCIALVIASGAVACKAIFETTLIVLRKLQDSET